MKHILTIFFLLSLAVSSYAQNLVCKIYYDYDAAGNRIKRHQECIDPNAPVSQSTQPPLHAILYSNPSEYMFNIDFQELLYHATISIATISGETVYQDEASMAYRMTFDFSLATPGEYVLTLIGIRHENDAAVSQNFKLVKW